MASHDVAGVAGMVCRALWAGTWRRRCTRCAAAPHCSGGAVQVDPGFSQLTLHVHSTDQHLKQNYDKLLSNSDFNLNLRHYTMETSAAVNLLKAGALTHVLTFNIDLSRFLTATPPTSSHKKYLLRFFSSPLVDRGKPIFSKSNDELKRNGLLQGPASR